MRLTYRFGAFIFGLVALLGSPVLASSANAHTGLETTTPLDGEVFSSMPEKIELKFTAPVNPGLSKIIITDEKGVTLQTTSIAQGVDKNRVSVKPETNRDGTFTVDWTATAGDGHPKTGKFKFTVKGAAKSSTTLSTASRSELTASSTTSLAQIVNVETSPLESSKGRNYGIIALLLSIPAALLVAFGIRRQRS